MIKLNVVQTVVIKSWMMSETGTNSYLEVPPTAEGHSYDRNYDTDTTVLGTIEVAEYESSIDGLAVRLPGQNYDLYFLGVRGGKAVFDDGYGNLTRLAIRPVELTA
jgi:hypothetical protein